MFGRRVLSYSEYFKMFKIAYKIGMRAYGGNKSLLYETRGLYFELNKLFIKERRLDKSNKSKEKGIKRLDSKELR